MAWRIGLARDDTFRRRTTRGHVAEAGHVHLPKRRAANLLRDSTSKTITNHNYAVNYGNTGYFDQFSGGPASSVQGVIFGARHSI